MLELDANFWAAYQTLVWLRVKQERLDEALVAAQKGIDLSNRTNAALGQIGHVYGRLGRKDEAAAVIRDLEQMFSNKRADGKDLAVVYAGLGEKDKAFEWLDKAYENHSFQLTTLNIEPLLQPLHDDPRWKDLKKRIGLPTE
jgi:tetratricopeptide (TPR) repeat protein